MKDFFVKIKIHEKTYKNKTFSEIPRKNVEIR